MVNEVISSRVNLEMVLRQIATYLSVTTQNLSEVHTLVLKFNTTLSDLKSETSKINTIENELIKLPAEFYKSKEAIEDKTSTLRRNQ